MYRIKLHRSPDGTGLVLSERDVARFCLAEGDELVVSEVVHNPAFQPETEEPAPVETATPPDAPAAREALPEPPEAPSPAAPRAEDSLSAEKTEFDKSAFRRLAR